MRIGRFQKSLLFISLLCFDVLLLWYLESEIHMRNYFSEKKGMEHFINFDMTSDVVEQFYEDADKDMSQFLSLLTIYMGTDCQTTDAKALLEQKELILRYESEAYKKVYAHLKAVFGDVTCFPVGKIENLPSAGYSYIDSWQYARNYGGDRLHEGCDIMADYNQRGIYPIYSATDGMVEKIGWLKLGGYRIGIRSSSGAYYYYAHLAEYAKEFEVGEEIKAGTLLGFMGDTGYGEVPGTYGKFDVHLHFGIYFNDETGAEYAMNPYQVLYFCEQRQKERSYEN